MTQKQFNSKFNIGQNVAEGIYQDLTVGFGWLEKGLFDKAFNKFKTIKSKIPINKLGEKAKIKFKALDEYYFNADKKKNKALKYKIIVKYVEYLIVALDKNSMYLPSLRDTSQFV